MRFCEEIILVCGLTLVRMDYISMKKRLGMLDLLRILAVTFIFLFHSHIHIDCNYYILTPFINMGAIFMTAFFIMSGFSVYYTNSENDGFNSKSDVILFYKKRVVAIIPMYWFMALSYPIWDIVVEKGSIINNIILAPIELLGLQSVFHSLFSFTHNGGTWFVSCIIFCYLVFPFIYNIIRETRIKSKIIIGIFLDCILLYSPLLATYLEVESLYSNPYFRTLEFVIGMLLCSIWSDVKGKKWYRRYIASRGLFSGVLLLLIIMVTIVAQMNILVGNYMVYSWIGLPCFSALVFCGAGVETPNINKSKFVKYAVDISYVFFFAQFYTWKTTSEILKRIGEDTNILRIVISLVVCIVIAILMHELIEKPLKKILSKKLL